MKIDYAAIKLADTGEVDVNDAFATMSAMTVDTYPETMLTYINIANKASFAVSAEVAAAVKTAITAESIPEWVEDALKTVGIDINNAETVGLLASIGVTASSITAITNIGKVVVPAFPSLRLGHLMTARTLTEEE